MVSEYKDGVMLCSRGKRKATSSTLLHKVLRIAEAYRCDACVESGEVVFVRPASATNKLAGFRLVIEPLGVRLVGDASKVPSHIVRMLLASLDDEFGLTLQTKEILKGLQNG
jgi:hypothetical protein